MSCRYMFLGEIEYKKINIFFVFLEKVRNFH